MISNTRPPLHIRSTFLIIMLVIIQAVSIASLIAWQLLFHYPIEPLNKADLTRIPADSSRTTFTVPKQWQKLDLGSTGGTAYGNEIGGEQSSGMIQILDASYLWPGLTTASTDEQKEKRELAYADIDKWINTSSDCSDKNILKKEKDISNSNDIFGLFTFHYSCIRSSGRTFITAVRFVVGSDGRSRIGLITARQDDWNTNQDVYREMLNSLRQAS